MTRDSRAAVAYHQQSMAELRDFGALSHISAEAIGEPGRRRFRLTALGQSGDSASMWLEKEQLAALGDAIETVLAGEGYQHSAAPPDDIAPPMEFPARPGTDFRIVQLSMGVDQRRGKMIIVAADAEEGGEVSVSMEIGFRSAYELRQQITAVIAAGRPPCPLCGGPLDPEGHVCPRTNGHHETA